MKDKILFFIDKDWIHFGIAKFLKEKHDCELYAIVDLDKTSSKFFNDQDLVHFKKIWFYQDYITKNDQVPDISYLKNFEKNHNINLWEIALTERLFIYYNKYHKFLYSEIISILERECKLFENILDEIKPDFLITKLTDSHQSHLLHQLCRNEEIKTLMLGWTRFGFRCAIYDEYDKFNDKSTKWSNSSKDRTTKELQNYLKKFHSYNAATPMIRVHKSIFHRMKKYFENLILLGSSDVKNYYPNYGRTWFSVLTQFIFIKKWYRKRFLDKYSIKVIDENSKFIYFPLHVEPERSLLLVAPYYTNQINMIKTIVKSLPVDYKLYVKEHRLMGNFGWRSLSDYKRIIDLPNVKLVHPHKNPIELQQKCSLVITIGGATGIEATFYGKPTIVFADVSYSGLPSVYNLKNLDELPNAIKKMLDTSVNYSSLNDYVNTVENNTFEIDLISLVLDFENFFVDEISTLRSNVSVSKMKSFIQKHSKEFELLADEHIKKINSYKKITD